MHTHSSMSSQLDDFLGANSSLTSVQVERLKLEVSLESSGVLEAEGENRASISGVTPGAYYRVLSQARNNINQSLYTLLFCTRLGIVKMDNIRRLLDLIAKVPPDVADVEANEVISLVDALVRKIVML